MYPAVAEITAGATILARAAEVLNDLLNRLKAPSEEFLVTATTDLFAQPKHQGFLYLITEGMLSLQKEGQTIFVIEQGDLIGAEESFGSKIGSYATEFAVKSKRFKVLEWQSAISADPQASQLWSEYLGLVACARLSLLFEVMNADETFIPEIRTIPAGTTIVKEGDPGDEVFTLIKGHANVYFQGTKVGEVLTDEIFGAIAALADIPRTATVKADTDCLILAISREKFFDLIKVRPHTVLRMVQDMARAIVDLNSRVHAPSVRI